MQSQAEILQMINQEKKQHFYTQKSKAAITQLQQSLQVLNQHFAAVLESMQADKAVANLIENIVKLIGELAKAMAKVKDLNCPAELVLLSKQEQALITVCPDVDAIRQLLASHGELHAQNNNSESYAIYHQLQQYFITLEQACVLICGAADSAQLETLMQTAPCNTVIALNEKVIQQLKETAHLLSYRQAYEKMFVPFQQALQALNQYIGTHTTEEAFVTHIYNGIIFTIFMDAVEKKVDALTKTMATLKGTEISAGLELLSHQQKALANIGDIALIKEVLTANKGLYGIYNYLESYKVYQGLQQYFSLLETACISICGAADTAQLEALQQNKLYQTVIELSEELIRMLITGDIKQNNKLQPAPTAPINTIDIREITIVSDESLDAAPQTSAGVDIKEVALINESAGATSTQINLSQLDSWGNHTENFLTTLPADILKLIADYLDPIRLLALVMANKQSARKLFNQLQHQPLPIALATYGSLRYKGEDPPSYATTFLYTPKTLYGCGKNDNGQLGVTGHLLQKNFTYITGIEGDILQVIARNFFTLVWTTVGLYGCGVNKVGQLGLGDTSIQTSFTRLPGIEGEILQVATGESYTLVLTTKGLYGCGTNGFGQLGLGHRKNQHSFVPISGIEGEIQRIWTGITNASTFVLTTQGLYGCGHNFESNLGLGHTDDEYSFTLIPGIEGEIKQVIVGWRYTLVLTTQGLYGCGYNRQGQFGLGQIDEQDSFTLIPGIDGEIKQVVIGLKHTLVVTTSGLFGSGNNEYGQLGLKYTERQKTFTRIPEIEGDILKVVTGSSHTVVLTTKGLYGCGQNQQGELGLGHTKNQWQFTRLPDVEGTIIQMVVGSGFIHAGHDQPSGYTLILTTNGLYGCGNNRAGQLGLGEQVQSLTFQKLAVPFETNAIKASCLSTLQSILNKDTTVPQVLSHPEELLVETVEIQDRSIISKPEANPNTLIPVAIKEVTISKEPTGTPSTQLDISKFSSWINNTEYNVTTLPAEILQLIADYLDPISLFALVIANKQSAKKLLAMLLQKQQLSIAIATASNNTFFYTPQTIYGCGEHINKETSQNFFRLDDLPGKILQVALNDSSNNYFMLIHTTRGLYGRGKNTCGQLGLGHKYDQSVFTRISGIEGDILQIAVGRQYALVLTTKGLYGSGINYSFQLGLKDRENILNFTLLPGIEGKILQIIVNSPNNNCQPFHTLVLTTTGLFGCGDNSFGQLGLGSKRVQKNFIRLSGIEGDILQVAATSTYTFVLTTTGLYSCGSNFKGHLLVSGRANHDIFTRISVIEGEILKIVTGPSHAFVLTTTGLFGCGNNSFGQLGIETKKQETFTLIPGIKGKVLQIATTDTHTIVLTTEGLYGCGNNKDGELGLGHTIGQFSFTRLPKIKGDIKQIVVGCSIPGGFSSGYTFVLTTEGLYGCGNNKFGQLGLKGDEFYLTLQKIKFPYLDKLRAYNQRPMLQAVLNKEVYPQTVKSYPDIEIKKQQALSNPDVSKVAIQEISITNKSAVPFGTNAITASCTSELQSIFNKDTEVPPALPHPEVPKVAIQEISITNRSKAYLIQLHLSVASESQKQQALQQLQEDIYNTTTLQALFDLFMRVKQADTGILRQHRKNLIYVYGDTESYKQALKYFITKMLAFLNSATTLKACDQLHVIMFEARCCQLPGEDWTQKLSEIKMLAAEIFQAELAAKKDLAGIFDLFNSINVQQPHGQTHILRLERKNIFHAYGDTDTYKQALFALAQKAVNVAFAISDDQEIRKMQIQLLKQLKENLQVVKPYFNKVWQAVIDKLEQKIEQAALIAEHTKSSSHTTVLKPAVL